MTSASRYDVLIVGAGPAGCVLANRLTQDEDRSVALLEAGPDYGPDLIDWPEEMRDPSDVAQYSHSWGYLHAGRGEDNRLELSRARVVGGTSTINGCIWLRGSAVDYDEWESLGNLGWSFDGLLPYFRRSESDPMGGPLHGANGPVPVFRGLPGDLTPVDHAFIASTKTLGLPEVEDANGDRIQRPSVGPPPKNVAEGVRMNAAFTYLAPARSRSNLAIVPNTIIDRILFEGKRAIGVRTGEGQAIFGDEVVLCAGAFSTPAILMRSGIGHAEHIRKFGIPVLLDLPGVGANLHDHPLVNGLMECSIAPGSEPAKRTFAPVLIRNRGKQTTEEIDYHIFHGQSIDTSRSAWNLWFSISLETARSRGSVRLTSADAEATLDIDHNYYADPNDLEIVCDAVEFVNELVRTPPLSDCVKPLPGRAIVWRDRDELRSVVRRNVGTTFHPSGTCRMGPESTDGSVVDTLGRIYGVENVRVADASIFPTIPRANIHATIVAVAEKLADAMLQV